MLMVGSGGQRKYLAELLVHPMAGEVKELKACSGFENVRLSPWLASCPKALERMTAALRHQGDWQISDQTNTFCSPKACEMIIVTLTYNSSG